MENALGVQMMKTTYNLNQDPPGLCLCQRALTVPNVLVKLSIVAQWSGEIDIAIVFKGGEERKDGRMAAVLGRQQGVDGHLIRHPLTHRSCFHGGFVNLEGAAVGGSISE